MSERDIDGVIRDLAEAHGHDNISDDTVREVRSTLSNEFLDDMLDSPTEQASSEESVS